MNIRKNQSGNYAASYRTREGKRRTISLKTKNLEEAKRLAENAGLPELEAAAKVARLTRETVARIVAGKRVTVSEAIKSWTEWMIASGHLAPRTINDYVQTVTRWCHEMNLNAKLISSLAENDISLWVNDPTSEAKAVSRRQYLNAVSVFMEYCFTAGWCGCQPAALVRVNFDKLSHLQKESKKVVPFTEKEVSKLLEATQGFWKVAIALAWELGLRLGDICQLEWRCFQKPETIVVWTDKRNRRVELPLSEKSSQLVSLIPIADSNFVFPDEREVMMDHKKRAALSVAFGRVCRRLGINGKSFHSLRHANATAKFKRVLGDTGNADEALKKVAKELGHGSVQTTQLYVHYPKKPA